MSCDRFGILNFSCVVDVVSLCYHILVTVCQCYVSIRVLSCGVMSTHHYTHGLSTCLRTSWAHWWLPYLLSSCHHHLVFLAVECNGLAVSSTSMHVCRQLATYCVSLCHYFTVTTLPPRKLWPICSSHCGCLVWLAYLGLFIKTPNRLQKITRTGDNIAHFWHCMRSLTTDGSMSCFLQPVLPCKVMCAMDVMKYTATIDCMMVVTSLIIL